MYSVIDVSLSDESPRDASLRNTHGRARILPGISNLWLAASGPREISIRRVRESYIKQDTGATSEMNYLNRIDSLFKSYIYFSTFF